MSDKHLTENCGLLCHLQPGDQVLAEWRLTVQNSVGLHCCRDKSASLHKGEEAAILT